MRNITVAAIQMRCVPDPAENLRTAERLVRQAAEQGAQVILLRSCLSGSISASSAATIFTPMPRRRTKIPPCRWESVWRRGAAHCAAHQLL